MTLYRTAEGLPGLSIAEWQSGELLDVDLSSRDLRLAERLRARSRDAAVDVRPVDGGVSVRSQGAVGLIRFQQFEVRIEPKLPGGDIQLFRMVEFGAGITGIAQLAGTPRIRVAGSNLLDLIVSLLAWLTERLMRGGLRADYVTHEDDLPVLRGRLLPDRQLLDRLGQYDRLICRYDEHEHNVPDNQLLARALTHGAKLATNATVRRRARDLAGELEEICDPNAFNFTDGPAGITYDRMNNHYREAHSLAWLLLGGTGPADELADGHEPARSFLIDMNELFEAFVERALRAILDADTYRVRAQKRDSIFWDVTRRSRYASVRPDLLVERRDRAQARFPIDAKYKRYGAGIDARRVDVADLSQVFLYAYAYRDPASPPPPRAALIFPNERAGEPELIRLEVRSVAERTIDAQLLAIGVHIPTLLDELSRGAAGIASSAIRELLTKDGPLASSSPSTIVELSSLAIA